VSAVTVAKAYRLVRATLNTALDDGAIRRNPCRIKGAGQEASPERPTPTHVTSERNSQRQLLPERSCSGHERKYPKPLAQLRLRCRLRV